jgi:lipopolysaccharide biosynthesis regulator YciM
MRRALAGAAALLFFGVLGYVAWANPHVVDVQFTGDVPLRMPLGWLLALTFVAGALLVVAVTALQRLVRAASRWPERRAARQAVRIAEWRRSAAALGWEGEVRRARALLTRAWRRRPADAAAALALAASYTDTGEFAAARQVLQEAVTRGATDPDVRVLLAEAVHRVDGPAEAIRILETVRVQHPHAPRLLAALRDRYADAGRWAEAAAVQAAYVEVLPADAAAERRRLLHLRYQAALALAEPGQRADALAVVVQMDRSYLPGLVSLGDALVASGRSAEAIKLWERALRERPATVLVERLLAHQHSARDRQRVITLLQKQRLAGAADAVHLLAARVALAEADVDGAAAELQAMPHATLPAARRLWAEVLLRRRQFEEAATALAALNHGSAAGEYHCTACGRTADAWAGHCLQCGQWDTYRSVVELGV